MPVHLVPRLGLAVALACMVTLAQGTTGAVLEQALSLIENGRPAEAVPLLERALSSAKGSSAETATLSALRRAHLEIAMAVMAGEKADFPAARAALAKIDATSHETVVGLANLAGAMLLWLEGHEKDATAAARTALKRWSNSELLSVASTDTLPLARDVRDVRDAFFAADNGFALLKDLWKDEPLPTLAPFVALQTNVRVTTADGAISTLHIRDPVPGAEGTLFLTIADTMSANRLIEAFAGRRPSAQLRDPQSRWQRVVDFWNAILPARQGNWGITGWSPYPTLQSVTFTDDQRTRATVGVSFRYYGATLLFEKMGGRWIAVKLLSLMMS